jgi:hypothetical protein
MRWPPCGAALRSSHRWISAFGIANLICLSITAWLLERSLTSVWFGHAAVVSFTFLVLFHHRSYASSESPEGGPELSKWRARA